MQRSEQIGELISALAKAQSEFTPAIKDVTSNAFAGRAYKYADLAANIGAVRPALSKHGIALLQFTDTDLEHQTASVTTALHCGEQWISQTAEAPALSRNGFDAQSIGACWTYLRRYTLQALCGMASEDDDASDLAGVDNKPVTTPRGAEARKAKEPAPEAQAPTGIRSQFFSKAKEYGWGLGELKKFVLMAYPDAKGSTANLTEEQLEQALLVMSENKPEDVLKA